MQYGGNNLAGRLGHLTKILFFILGGSSLFNLGIWVSWYLGAKKQEMYWY